MLQPYFTFLDSFDYNFADYHLPQNVMNWGDEVWEKSFYCYLQDAKKYVAFPRYSLTSDFADVGVHMKKQTNKYAHQSQLFLGKSFAATKGLDETENVYDALYELSFDTLVNHLPELAKYEIEVDMYGNKDFSKSNKKYALSSKKCAAPILEWDRRLKPEVNNVLMNQQGKFYSLALQEDFTAGTSKDTLKEKFLYYYPDTRLSTLLKMKWSEVISRFVK